MQLTSRTIIAKEWLSLFLANNNDLENCAWLLSDSKQHQYQHTKNLSHWIYWLWLGIMSWPILTRPPGMAGQGDEYTLGPVDWLHIKAHLCKRKGRMAVYDTDVETEMPINSGRKISYLNSHHDPLNINIPTRAFKHVVELKIKKRWRKSMMN